MCEIFLAMPLIILVVFGFLGDSLADYLEAKAEELRARAKRLKKENEE